MLITLASCQVGDGADLAAADLLIIMGTSLQVRITSRMHRVGRYSALACTRGYIYIYIPGAYFRYPDPHRDSFLSAGVVGVPMLGR